MEFEVFARLNDRTFTNQSLIDFHEQYPRSCNFCLEAFTTELLMKAHVERTHFDTSEDNRIAQNSQEVPWLDKVTWLDEVIWLDEVNHQSWRAHSKDFPDSALGGTSYNISSPTDGQDLGQRSGDERERPLQDQILGFKYDPTPCFIGDCRGDYTFPTESSYHAHRRNVHNRTIYRPILPASVDLVPSMTPREQSDPIEIGAEASRKKSNRWRPTYNLKTLKAISLGRPKNRRTRDPIAHYTERLSSSTNPGSRNWKALFPFRENTRKILRILICNKEQIACPDSGSEKNIMSEAFALENGFEITRKVTDIKPFELGNGKKVWSIGRVKTTVKLLSHTLRKRLRWFYVFATCPVPLILGMSFLAEAKILIKNRHMLETCPEEFATLSSLLWIGSPREKGESPCNRIKCTLDGKKVMAVADTGSDLNFMCPNCAEREGFHVDGRDEARIQVQLGDGSVAETIGQVYIHNLSLDWREPVTKLSQPARSSIREGLSSSSEVPEESCGTIFHVLPGLGCDVILGRDVLDETDAFNCCSGLSCSGAASSQDPYELNILIFKKKKRKHAEMTSDPKEVHDDERHAEMLRRSRREDEISLLTGDRREQARGRERILCRAWDDRHAACIYCAADT
ncbi:uncharacterized protein LY89DRAFT_154980 [Mollisia scopiformis]|uniref:C2H2-type domain-containing protein n=1 Tax=Mollisia scopiformis TaxID=149040 RepID=A0A194WZ18_MOLSC|nr:uncharacterized protein LY89DRAFT_154980 [Mollisia scopiformis]KUJ13201.1 hypothetical protein LY89DRAFT_154980 [Mollisia scopiformis]